MAKAPHHKKHEGNEDPSFILKNEMIKKQRVGTIRAFINGRGIPGWFRGTSAFQMDAADELLNAIRDDTEQRTAHRVRAVLMRIGIEPLITVAETKLLMRLSRGNDLAFLWFLMELHYKTPSSNFSVNEQLIMSSMAHLDMITTMRELDRILPPSSMSKREWLKRQKAKQQHQKPKPKSKVPKPQYVLPYFEKLVRPRYVGKSLSIPKPDFKVNFGVYNNYKDPNYIVHNESNRWYANYQLQPGNRIVHGIIREELNRIFDDFEATSLKADQLTVLCGHHKFKKEMEEAFQNELRVLAREHCKQYLDVNESKQKARETRIRNMLEKDVRRYLCKYRKFAAKTEQQMLVMTVGSECDCQYHLVDISGEPCKENGNLDPIKAETKTGLDAVREKSNMSAESQFGWDNVKVNVKGNVKENRKENKNPPGLPYDPLAMADKCENTISNKSLVQIMGRNLEIESPVECKFGCNRITQTSDCEQASNTASNIFFEAPTEHKPYHFNYETIFNFKEHNGNELHVNRTIIKALDSKVKLPLNVPDSRLKGIIFRDDAVRDCAKRIWLREVTMKNAEIEAEEERIRNEAMKSQPLNYNLEYYDPEDRKLMKNMLKDALDYMKKNPKFILPTLPESHKTPLLFEWMLQRYGKEYTTAERYNLFYDSTKIFRVLNKMSLTVPYPAIAQLGRKGIVDYSCRDYLVKKSNNIRAEYFKRLDKAIMEQSRVFWFAMRAYLCSNGPPRNTFYAYLPARTKDIMHFAIWKPGEFNNAKAQWDHRMHMKNREDKL